MPEIDEYERALIDDEYEVIMDKLKNGQIYGVPIDTSDIKMLVVSAYLMGKQEEVIRQTRE